MEECAVGERETRPLKVWKANEWPLVSHQSILPCSIPSFCTCRGNVTRFLNWAARKTHVSCFVGCTRYSEHVDFTCYGRVPRTMISRVNVFEGN